MRARKLSAFGPLYAVLLVAGPKHQLGQAFGRWRTNPAVHAGAHLDHFERAPRTDLRLYVIHVAVAWVLAAFAARALAKTDAGRPGT